MKRGETELTTEQLEMARRHLARPGWPATLEETMRDPARAGCIRGLARSFSRGGTATEPRYVPPTPQHAPPVPPTPTEPPTRKQAHLAPKRTAARFDARKAAANDLDD